MGASNRAKNVHYRAVNACSAIHIGKRLRQLHGLYMASGIPETLVQCDIPFIRLLHGAAAMILATVALFAAAAANVLLVTVIADRFGFEGQDARIAGGVPTAA